MKFLPERKYRGSVNSHIRLLPTPARVSHVGIEAGTATTAGRATTVSATGVVPQEVLRGEAQALALGAPCRPVRRPQRRLFCSIMDSCRSCLRHRLHRHWRKAACARLLAQGGANSAPPERKGCPTAGPGSCTPEHCSSPADHPEQIAETRIRLAIWRGHPNASVASFSDLSSRSRIRGCPIFNESH